MAEGHWTQEVAKRRWKCDFCLDLIKKDETYWHKSEWDALGKLTWRRHHDCRDKPL